VFQRTPQWIAPTPNRDFSEKIKQKCRDNPLRIELAKKVYGTVFEQIFSKALVGNKLSHAILSLACKLNLRLSVKDRQLRKKLTPDYQVGCKRLVMSGTFYEAMQRPNTPIGNFSVIAMSEVQVPYVIQLIERWRDGEYDEVVCTQKWVNMG
jgi:cation diffusion facilitator CzcD-associated flavoprotein CzcO